MPALTTVLGDPLYYDRAYAARSLGQIGHADKEILEALRKSLVDKHQEVRAYAAIAIWQLKRDTKLTLPVMVEALKNKDDLLEHWTKKLVIQSIGEMGKNARNAVPILIPLLQERQHGIARVTGIALQKLIAENAK